MLGTGPHVEETSKTATLTIGDLADRTGVSSATLRVWEQRHGFPRPQRLESGHRRYSEDDVETIRGIVRRKSAGLRLEQAIEQVLAESAPAAPSVYAVLRERHPALTTYRLSKRTLLALSFAIEDEFCAKAVGADLYGAFQKGRYFEHSEDRWAEMARTSRSATVFADFEETDAGRSPARVRLADDAPMRREWTIVCHSSELPVVLTAWELPGQEKVADRRRVFESMWTVDPAAVHDAARVCAGLAGHDPAGVALPAPSPPDLAAVTALYNRVVYYTDRLD